MWFCRFICNYLWILSGFCDSCICVCFSCMHGWYWNQMSTYNRDTLGSLLRDASSCICGLCQCVSSTNDQRLQQGQCQVRETQDKPDELAKHVSSGSSNTFQVCGDDISRSKIIWSVGRIPVNGRVWLIGIFNTFDTNRVELILLAWTVHDLVQHGISSHEVLSGNTRRTGSHHSRFRGGWGSNWGWNCGTRRIQSGCADCWRRAFVWLGILSVRCRWSGICKVFRQIQGSQYVNDIILKMNKIENGFIS